MTEDTSKISAGLPVGFSTPRSCLGTHSKEIFRLVFTSSFSEKSSGKARAAIEAFKSGLMAYSPPRWQISEGASAKGTRCSWQDSQSITLCGNLTCGCGVAGPWARLRPYATGNNWPCT